VKNSELDGTPKKLLNAYKHSTGLARLLLLQHIQVASPNLQRMRLMGLPRVERIDQDLETIEKDTKQSDVSLKFFIII
jgi:hypothetical protein